MEHALEMALRLFSPRSSLGAMTRGSAGLLSREEILGALQAAAKGNPLGYHFLMAEHLLDEQSLQCLVAHFTNLLGSEAASAAAALLLRRPMPEQLERLVPKHPYYDAERRRASVLMERAKRAHRAGDEPEYQRLKSERNALLAAARDRCVDDILLTGRCPNCRGTGRRVRAGDECLVCHGSGRVVPDRRFIIDSFGHEMTMSIEREVDDILAQASQFSSEMNRQCDEMIAVRP